MSQLSGAGSGGVGSARVGANRFSSSGRAALLLALAVVVGVVALQQIDDSAKALPGASAAKQEAAAQTPVQPAPTVAPIVRSPAEVKVLVANGVGVDGAAAKVAGTLQPIGYQLLKPGNTTQTQTTSGVQYAPGYESEAKALATSIGLPATSVVAMANPAPVTDLQSANVIVVVGNELANKAQQQPANGQQSNSTAQQSTTANANAATATNGPLTTTPQSSTTTLRSSN